MRSIGLTVAWMTAVAVYALVLPPWASLDPLTATGLFAGNAAPALLGARHGGRRSGLLVVVICFLGTQKVLEIIIQPRTTSAPFDPGTGVLAFSALVALVVGAWTDASHTASPAAQQASADAEVGELEARLTLQRLAPRDERNHLRIAEIYFGLGEPRLAMRSLSAAARARRGDSRPRARSTLCPQVRHADLRGRPGGPWRRG